MTKTGRFFVITLIVLILGGCFWIWNKWTGHFKFGAEVITGCQSTSLISSFLGSPGSSLATYNLFGHEVTVNEKIVSFLDGAQKEINDAKTGYSFDDIQTYNNRSKRGGGGKSLHSWGIALDINPPRNPMQSGFGAPQTDIPQKVIDIFRKYGFIWGGEWVGQADPMHFEWYGAGYSGSIVNTTNQNKITDASMTADGGPVNTANGDFGLVLPATHSHEIIVKARGYEENKFSLNLSCFETRNENISMKPLPDNLPGSISGKVTLGGGRSLLIPATIYLDGKVVGASNIRGDYIISGVQRGKHKVEAKILLFPSASVETPEMVPGENILNFNLTIGG